MDHLTFVESTLPLDGSRPRSKNLDIVVNGTSLRASIGEDLLGWTSTPLQSGWELEAGIGWLASLSLGLEGSLPVGQVRLYVCRECGDLGCGALTVNIERGGNWVRWNQFGWEDSLGDDPYVATESRREFTFQAAAYDEMLRAVGKRVLASRRQPVPTGHLWWREPGFVAIDLWRPSVAFCGAALLQRATDSLSRRRPSPAVRWRRPRS